MNDDRVQVQLVKKYHHTLRYVSREKCLFTYEFGVKFWNKIWNKMSLWLDKHRPTSLAKLDYHKEQALHLKKLVTDIYHF